MYIALVISDLAVPLSLSVLHLTLLYPRFWHYQEWGVSAICRHQAISSQFFPGLLLILTNLVYAIRKMKYIDLGEHAP